MTKSEMQWERNFDEERASSIARRFAIEDFALKYRTSLRTAEELLTSGMTVERHADESKGPKSPDIIEIDDTSNETKLESHEDMEVDVERLDTDHELVYRERENDRKQATKIPPFGYHRSRQFSPRSRKVFVFSSKPTSPTDTFNSHSYPSPRFSSQTWPYCATYPHLARETSFARSYPLLYNMTGSKTLPRHVPIELLRNYYSGGQTVDEKRKPKEAPHETSQEELSRIQKPRMLTLQAERSRRFAPPRRFSPSEERPRASAPPEESPRIFIPSQAGPRVFLPKEERATPRTFEEENARWSKMSDEKSETFSSNGVRFERLYEKRPRSYTPPSVKEELKQSLLKPRRHSDDTVSNVNRPSVLVMQRSLSNPITTCHDHGEDHCEPCSWTEENQLTDSDSSATPPLAQEGSLSSGDSSKEDKPHKCQICGRAFRKHSALVIHHRVHSGEKPYRCPECSKNFSISGNLRRHFLIHTGERPYVCPECSRAFNNPSHLTRHRRKLHADFRRDQLAGK
ncbi:Krueppel-related zinc finger protein 1-like isoform X2 [Dendronephthya gigantea]|nr:Krueppel-related zinc finger protein 1-like isoform X2 [Dendronephthya gigantea]